MGKNAVPAPECSKKRGQRVLMYIASNTLGNILTTALPKGQFFLWEPSPVASVGACAVKMETRHPVDGQVGRDFRRSVIIAEL